MQVLNYHVQVFSATNAQPKCTYRNSLLILLYLAETEKHRVTDDIKINVQMNIATGPRLIPTVCHLPYPPWFLLLRAQLVGGRFIYSHDRSDYSAAGKQVNRSQEYINRSQILYMNVEIRTEAAPFLFEEYINRIFQCFFMTVFALPFDA